MIFGTFVTDSSDMSKLDVYTNLTHIFYYFAFISINLDIILPQIANIEKIIAEVKAKHSILKNILTIRLIDSKVYKKLMGNDELLSILVCNICDIIYKCNFDGVLFEFYSEFIDTKAICSLILLLKKHFDICSSVFKMHHCMIGVSFDSVTQDKYIEHLSSIENYIDFFMLICHNIRTNKVLQFTSNRNDCIEKKTLDILTFIDSHKLVLCIPIFGRLYTNIENNCNVSSYEPSIIKRDEIPIGVDIYNPLTKSVIRRNKYLKVQCMYENTHTLKFKLNLINNKKLSGLAIFSLGYDDTLLTSRIVQKNNTFELSDF